MAYEYLDKFMKYYEESNYLQGNLLIWHKGNIIHNKSYGLSNIEMNVVNSCEKKFKIASLTKAFTAMITLRLHDLGLLNIYDSVQKYLPLLNRYEPVTIYHCLTCSSGIPDFANKLDYWDKDMRIPNNISNIIDNIYLEGLNFAPGTAYEYSSTGYLVITKIIEEVTQSSYDIALKKYILNPLGMEDSGCMNNIDIVRNLVESYGFWIDEIQSAKTDMSFPTGAAGMYSTTTDLLKWGKAIIEKRLLSEELYRVYESVNQETYACGWDITTIGQSKILQHQGDLDGFVTSIKLCREEDLIVIFLSNQEIIPVTTITKKIVEHVLGKAFSVPLLKEISISKEILLRVVNRYHYIDSVNSKKMDLEVTLVGEQLFLCCTKRYDIQYKFRLNCYYDEVKNVVLKAEKINERLVFSPNRKPTYIMLNGEKFTLNPYQ
ncbi:serine hydrolase domain-containing protein [Enterococcus sp. LJL99]